MVRGNKVFGYVGKPANRHGSFSSLYDISADYAVSKQISLPFRKTVVAAINPRDRDAEYGFFELDYRFAKPLGHAPVH